MRHLSPILVVVAALAAFGCADDEAGGGEAGPEVHGLSVSGDAIPFSNGPDGRIDGATVTVLERPDKTLVTGLDGTFFFDGFQVGDEVTLRMERLNFPKIQTGTLVMPPEGLTRVTFQAVQQYEYDGMALMVGITPDATKCQIVTTVTRVGKSIYDEGAHGEADVVVTIDPPVPAEVGPIYFNAQVRPDRAQPITSEDGGVLFVNVPPGVYTLTGTKAGATFRTVKARCEAGWLVNASPPWGLQRIQ